MQEHTEVNRVETTNHRLNGASSMESPMSRGEFLRKTGVALCGVLAAAPMAAVLSSCGGGSGGRDGGSGKIKMTTEAGNAFLRLVGSGIATVDWGDGSEKISRTLNEKGVEFEHTYPSVSIRSITITGKKITALICSEKKLTSLDVSRCTELESLLCFENRLTALDVSKNTALTRLNCENNPLTVLDVSKNTALTDLYCNSNQLTALDVSRNTALTWLECSGNQITALDVSKNTALTYLDCIDNQLGALDVSKNVALTWLRCSGNQLTALDVSKNTALTILECQYNQLSAAALNALFGTLHNNTIQGKYYGITIDDNPGTESCNRSIAEDKGWTVDGGV